MKKVDLDGSSEEDVSRYDRQLHCFGMKSASQLKGSRVLVCGFDSVGVELVKNLCLHGIGKIVICDEADRKVLIEDCGTGCVFTKDTVGEKRISELHLSRVRQFNPSIRVESIELKTLLKEGIVGYNVVVCANLEKIEVMKVLCSECEKTGTSFLVCNVRGLSCRVLGGDLILKIYSDRWNGKLSKYRGRVYAFGDYSNMKRNLLHLGYRIIQEFFAKHGRFPRPHSNVDFEENFVPIMKRHWNLVKGDTSMPKGGKEFLKMFCLTCKGSIAPLVTMCGGYCSCEVIKRCLVDKESRKTFSRVNEFYVDFYEILPTTFFDDVKKMTDELKEDLETSAKSEGLERYLGNIRIFGLDFQRQITTEGVFLPGMGALGCESLKLCAQMGVRKIFLTDFDGISVSNLSRQFLFRDCDVGKPKSSVAAKTIVDILGPHNAKIPPLEVVSFCEKVPNGTIFDENFYKKIGCIIGGFDNVEARYSILSSSKFYEIPLLDAGTSGLKGNAFVFVPFETETKFHLPQKNEHSYDSCTLKNRPSRVEHLLHWSIFEFANLFSLDPKNYNDGDEIVEEASLVLFQNEKFLKDRPTTYFDCVYLAKELFVYYFKDNIQELKDKKLDEFHSVNVKVIDFDLKNTLHVDFVDCTAQLIMKVFNISSKREKENVDLVKYLSTLENKKKTKKDENEKNKREDIDTKLSSIDFDKDKILHLDFLRTSSSLRQMNYYLEEWGEIDFFTIKKKAGLIIPASQCTSAVAQGYILMMYCQLILYKLYVLPNSQKDKTKKKKKKKKRKMKFFDYMFDLQYNNLVTAEKRDRGGWIQNCVNKEGKCNTLKELAKEFPRLSYIEFQKKSIFDDNFDSVDETTIVQSIRKFVPEFPVEKYSAVKLIIGSRKEKEEEKEEEEEENPYDLTTIKYFFAKKETQ